MKLIALQDLMRCPKAWHTLIPLGTLRGGELIIEDSLADSLKNCPETVPVQNWDVKFAPSQSQIAAKHQEPLPQEQWPLWIKTAALEKNDSDKGVGDTLARCIGAIGGNLYKAWYEKITGQKCGCSERQELLNLKYPFALTSSH
jgi:hypothetical protein